VVGIDFISLLLISLGLSADCFAVAVSGSIALKRVFPLQVVRLALAFGFAQAVMPLLGWLAGRTVVDIISTYDHWVAFALLAGVGGKMLWEAFHAEEGQTSNTDITRGIMLLTLAVATSIDSLAVGLSFAFLEVNIALASVTIGLVAFIVTAVSFLIGMKLGSIMEKRAEMIGGLVLIAIGIRIVLEHLLG
jgi:putative Mn2+ efflux pump MntP